MRPWTWLSVTGDTNALYEFSFGEAGGCKTGWLGMTSYTIVANGNLQINLQHTT